MAKPYMGAWVRYCGHEGYFIADIHVVGNVNVIRANGPVSSDNIHRAHMDLVTHHLVDFPVTGFWQPRLGIFVVPEDQCYLVKKEEQDNG